MPAARRRAKEALAQPPQPRYSLNMFSERVHPSLQPGGARVRQKAATRQKLLRAARRLFERNGFQGTTLRQLADETGLAPGTVFVHFKDKHALLAATLHQGVEAALQRATARRRRRSGTRAQLLGLVEPLLRHYARKPALSRVLLKEGPFLAGDDGQRFDAQLGGFQATVERVYADAVARRELAANADCRGAATAFLAFYLFALIAGLRGTAPPVPAQLRLLGGLVDQQLAGLQRRPR